MSQSVTLKQDMLYKVGDKVRYVKRDVLPLGWSYVSASHLGKEFIITLISEDGRLHAKCLTEFMTCYFHPTWIQPLHSWVACRKSIRR